MQRDRETRWRKKGEHNNSKRGDGGRDTRNLDSERIITQNLAATSTTAVPMTENRLHIRTNTTNGEGAGNRTVQSYTQSRKNKHNSIVHMTINAQSLSNKKDELKMIVNKHKPLIIGVTETWADENKSDGNYKLDEYIMYRDDRVAGRGVEQCYTYQYTSGKENV